jgi:hypothetical protein
MRLNDIAAAECDTRCRHFTMPLIIYAKTRKLRQRSYAVEVFRAAGATLVSFYRDDDRRRPRAPSTSIITPAHTAPLRQPECS